MNIYKRIIIFVSTLLFILLALLAGIITDLNDREFPQAIGAKSKLYMNFNESALSITEAFSRLEELDKDLDLGLIKVSPDLANDKDSKVFISLNDSSLPDQFNWFSGDDIGKIVDKERLANSYPDGLYLLTKNTTHLKEFEHTLKSAGVEVSRIDVSILDNLMFIVMERGFTTVILASLTLISSLVLFWLSVRAHRRALLVLGGAPMLRIHWQDLASFGGALLISAGSVAIVATIYVGVLHGWIYIATFLKILINLQAAVIAFSMLVALIMSNLAWPSATMLATRQPAVKSLRLVAITIQALTFILVIATTAPTWSAFKQSSAKATEIAQWQKLSDQVSIVFATDIDGMKHTEPMIGELVKDAEANGAVALSYTYTKEIWPSVNFGNYSSISFVNEHWLDLVTMDEQQPTMTAVSHNDIPKNITDEIQEELEILWGEDHTPTLFKQLQFYQPVKGYRLPIIQGGGQGLHFEDRVLLIVVPSLYDTFSESTLTSMISSDNIIFTGAVATEQLLKNHHLDIQSFRDLHINGELKVVYMAEEGILQAQFAAYLVWLQGLSLITLVIAFSIATIIHSWITATLQARRDFPLRLSGKSWRQIIQGRVIKEWLGGIILTIIIVSLQKPDELNIVLLTVTYGLLIILLAHLFAVYWCFTRVSKRKI